MTIEIFLTEGPNVEGLPLNREVLYVGHSNEDDNGFWSVIDGIKNDNPKSYRFHIGEQNSLQEVKINRFQYSADETILDFEHENKPGRIVISNRLSDGKYFYNGLERNIQTVYNLFGIREASSMLPHEILPKVLKIKKI